MPGPAPKLHRQRDRDEKRRTSEFTHVVADGRARGPRLTSDEEAAYLPSTVDAYRTMRHSPQAQLYSDTDWLMIRQVLLPLMDSFGRNRRKPATTAAEIRQILASLGGTYVDRLKARIAIDPASTAKTNHSTEPAEVIDFSVVLRGKK